MPATKHQGRPASLAATLGIAPEHLGVMIVDHGSRRQESNDALLEVVELFRSQTSYQLVEPAHMELAQPSIATAFDRLVQRGAQLVIVHPYFLLPGRHWAQDIPELAAQASRKHAGVQHFVTAPLGIHPLMANIMNDRILHCLSHVAGVAESCDICDDQGHCRIGEQDASQ